MKENAINHGIHRTLPHNIGRDKSVFFIFVYSKPGRVYRIFGS
jgi:hypothetical protein